MPVADVRSVLAAPDTDARNRLIVEHLDRLELELAQTRAAVGELRSLLEPEAPHPIERLKLRANGNLPPIAASAHLRRIHLCASPNSASAQVAHSRALGPAPSILS